MEMAQPACIFSFVPDVAASGAIFYIILSFPVVAAVLAYPHGFVRGLYTLFFVPDQRRKKCRDGQKQPFERHPPPADEAPPQATVALINQLRFRNHLHIDVFASTPRASHKTFSFVFAHMFVIIFVYPDPFTVPNACAII